MDRQASPNPLVSRIADSYSRRRVVASTAALAAGTAFVSTTGSDTARAAVSVESLSVADAAFESEAVDPVVDVTVGYEYAVETADEVVVELLVEGDVVADESLRTSKRELETETDLSARVTRSNAWERSDFAVDRGDTLTREVEVGVRFAVRADGETVADDEATDTAEIVVEHPESGAFARVGGEGAIHDDDGSENVADD